MLYEIERQKLASNLNFPGWPRTAQGEVWRGVLSYPQKGDKLDKNEAGRGEARHLTSGRRQVKTKPLKISEWTPWNNQESKEPVGGEFKCPISNIAMSWIMKYQKAAR